MIINIGSSDFYSYKYAWMTFFVIDLFLNYGKIIFIPKNPVTRISLTNDNNDDDDDEYH